MISEIQYTPRFHADPKDSPTVLTAGGENAQAISYHPSPFPVRLVTYELLVNSCIAYEVMDPAGLAQAGIPQRGSAEVSKSLSAPGSPMPFP